MLDLGLGARTDERPHFYLGWLPQIVSHRVVPGFRWTQWRVMRRDGSEGRFVSCWLTSHMQAYWGDGKVDATRTRLYWSGALDDGKGEPYVPDQMLVVYTDHPKELRAFRWRTEPPPEPTWDNMGGT